MHYYSSESLRIADDLWMLPQRGAVSGGTGRPPNSYALLFFDHSVLFDAAYSWNLAGLDDLARSGRPPRTLVLSHRNVPGGADALSAIRSRFGLTVLLHPADAEHAEARDQGPYDDPREDATLASDGLEVLHVPGHTAGSVMLYWPEYGGVLLTGDCAVGPGPRQAPAAPLLQRPVLPDQKTAEAFGERWREIISS